MIVGSIKENTTLEKEFQSPLSLQKILLDSDLKVCVEKRICTSPWY